MGAANVCLDTYGGNGFVDTYDVERKFRETRLYTVAPVGNNLIYSFIATKLLGLPRLALPCLVPLECAARYCIDFKHMLLNIES